MHTTNISVEKHFLHCINSFASWVLSLLFSDEEPSADESENEHFFFSTHFLSWQSCHNRHHPTVTAVRQPWIPFACTVSVVMCKGFSAYSESFFPKASSGWTDRYAWYFQLFICWNLCRTSSPSLHHQLDLRLLHGYAIPYPCTALHQHLFFLSQYENSCFKKEIRYQSQVHASPRKRKG